MFCSLLFFFWLSPLTVLQGFSDSVPQSACLRAWSPYSTVVWHRFGILLKFPRKKHQCFPLSTCQGIFLLFYPHMWCNGSIPPVVRGGIDPVGFLGPTPWVSETGVREQKSGRRQSCVHEEDKWSRGEEERGRKDAALILNFCCFAFHKKKQFFPLSNSLFSSLPSSYHSLRSSCSTTPRSLTEISKTFPCT